MEGCARFHFVQWGLAAAGCLVAGVLAAGFAQELPVRSEAAVDSLLAPPLAAEQPLRFDSTTADLGTLREEDAPVQRRFRFTNRSDTPVVIVRIGVGCRCLAAKWTRGVIAPGASGSVELTYTPENHPGRIDASAFVYVTGTKQPAARLSLTGEVKPAAGPWARFPHAMGTLRLKRRTVTFRDLEPGAKAVERILCGNAGERPLCLTGLLLPEFAAFDTDPTPIPPGAEADIVIRIDEAFIPASHEGELVFPVVIGGVEGRPADRTLTVRITRKNKNITD